MSSIEQIQHDVRHLRAALATLRGHVKQCPNATAKSLAAPLVAEVGRLEKALDAAEKATEAPLADRARLQVEISECDAERRAIVSARAALPYAETFDAARFLELREAADVNAARDKWLRTAYDNAETRALGAATKTIAEARRFILALDEHEGRARRCFRVALDPHADSIDIKGWARSASPLEVGAFAVRLAQVRVGEYAHDTPNNRDRWAAALAELLGLLERRQEAA